MPFDNDDFKVDINSETDFSMDTSSTDSAFAYRRSGKSHMLHRIRSKLLKMERSQNFIGSIYRETMKSMLHIMGGFNYINSKDEIVSISCSHGNPERVIAKIKDKANIILPVITIIQTTTENDELRRKYAPSLSVNSVWNDKKQRAERVVGFIDRPITILYKVNIWTKYSSDMGQIVEQIRLLFNPSIDVPTKFSTLTKANLVDESNLSETDTGDAGDRVLRREMVVEVETYAPSPKFLLTSTGKIESYNMEVELYKNS